MPDTRSHRGPHPEDANLFTVHTQPLLASAVTDMCWLLSKGYADRSSLKLVGNRYNLTRRQRLAVMRCSCSDDQAIRRSAHQLALEDIEDHTVILDGYNILITVEATLAGGVLLMGCDGCIRDLASIHGTYRKVVETLPAIEWIAAALKQLSTGQVIWTLDKPVSNSGRLKQLIEAYAGGNGLNWTVELLTNPDKALIESNHVVASSDSAILDRCYTWFNLSAYIIAKVRQTKTVHLFDLRLDTKP